VEGGVGPETQRALRNIGAVLDAAGLGFADVVKTTCFLADIADFAAFNEAYAPFFPDPPPARSTVGVGALPRGARVEVEVVAKRPTGA
jgi:2-iminobutanoate/2-iminopropanoate deaminase